MIRLGLTGHPLDHSLSPQIHAAALEACGLEGNYSLFAVHPHDTPVLEELFARVRRGELTGLNLTIPHKQTAIRFLDEISPAADAIGAVNTVFRQGGKLTGENTDAAGFLFDLKRSVGNGESGAGRSALVLGAGGSARAVVYALLADGWRVTLAARRFEQARQLAASFADRGLRILERLQDADLPGTALVVNATPIGMFPKPDESPWPADLPFPDAAIYDLVYNPPETKLVKAARAAGLPAATGLGMLVEQAALAFEIWTGRRPPREALFRAVVRSVPA